MPIMDYNIEVLRGWPGEMALDRVEPIKAGVTLNNGDWVEKQADGTVDKTSATVTNTAGVVVRGNGDSASAAYVNGSIITSGTTATAATTNGRALVLWGSHISRISNYDTGGTYAPGTKLTIKSGKVTSVAAGTDPVAGFVLYVAPATTGNTAHIVAVFK